MSSSAQRRWLFRGLPLSLGLVVVAVVAVEVATTWLWADATYLVAGVLAVYLLIRGATSRNALGGRRWFFVVVALGIIAATLAHIDVRAMSLDSGYLLMASAGLACSALFFVPGLWADYQSRAFAKPVPSRDRVASDATADGAPEPVRTGSIPGNIARRAVFGVLAPMLGLILLFNGLHHVHTWVHYGGGSSAATADARDGNAFWPRALNEIYVFTGGPNPSEYPWDQYVGGDIVEMLRPWPRQSSLGRGPQIHPHTGLVKSTLEVAKYTGLSQDLQDDLHDARSSGYREALLQQVAAQQLPANSFKPRMLDADALRTLYAERAAAPEQPRYTSLCGNVTVLVGIALAQCEPLDYDDEHITVRLREEDDDTPPIAWVFYVTHPTAPERYYMNWGPITSLAWSEDGRNLVLFELYLGRHTRALQFDATTGYLLQAVLVDSE